VLLVEQQANNKIYANPWL